MSSKARKISNKLLDEKKNLAAFELTTTLPGSIFSTCAMVSMEDEKTTLTKFMQFEEDFKNGEVLNIETIEEMVNYIKKEFYNDITLPDTTALVYDMDEKRTPLITLLKPEEDGTLTPVPIRRDGWPTMALLSEHIGYELLYGDDE